MLTTIWALALVGAVGLYATRTRDDPVTLLTVHLVLLCGVSARWVLQPLGAIGQPAQLIAFVALWWWVVARLRRDPGLSREPSRVRTGLVVLGWFLLLSASLAYTRHLSPLEISASARAVLRHGSLIGIALLATDGVSSRARLDTLLRNLVLAASFVALIGIVQFVAGSDAWTQIRWPVLQLNRESATVGARALFNRPFATALHPIEFGVVTASVLPLAVHLALDGQGRNRMTRWGPPLLLGAAVPMSVSRSAIVSLLVGALLIAARWTWARRLRMGAAAAAFTILLWGVVPGLLGTVVSLFENSGSDPSVLARTQRFPRVVELWSQRPILGRGFGTFTIEEQFLLDNNLYSLLIDTGVVGLLLWISVIVGICVTAWVATRRSDQVTRQLCGAIVASIGALTISGATFDAYGYRILSGMLFLLLGCAGALARLSAEDVTADALENDQDRRLTGV